VKAKTAVFPRKRIHDVTSAIDGDHEVRDVGSMYDRFFGVLIRETTFCSPV
jgi:hypothetical protein